MRFGLPIRSRIEANRATKKVMAKTLSGTLPPLVINPASSLPLNAQLVASLRDAIRTGRLPPGRLLPPTREVALQLDIGRNTVVDAYQFASEWGGNSPEQRAATRACKAALAREVDPETARGVFVAFARSKDILVEDATIPIRRKEQPSHV